MGWVQSQKLLWKLGDLATETGAVFTNWNANGQAWMDASVEPLTAGRFTGAAGIMPLAARFNIETHGCDMLAISFAGKITAVGTTTAAVTSTIAPWAFGTPFYNRNNVTAWQMPHSMRVAQGNVLSAGQFNNDVLYIYGDSALLAGSVQPGADGGPVIANAFMQGAAAGRTPVAGDYVRWHFFLGRRGRYDTTPSAATAQAIPFEPSVKGFSLVNLAMNVQNAASNPGTMSMAAEMWAHRIFFTTTVPGLTDDLT